MSTHRASTHIDRPPSQVFPWLYRPEHLANWLQGFVASQPIGQGPIGVGTRSTDTFDEGGRRIAMETEITEWDPPHRLAVRIVNPHVRGDTRYDLVAEDSGCQVRFEGRFRYRGIARLLAPLLRRTVQRRQEDDLGRLKRAIESAAPAASTP